MVSRQNLGFGLKPEDDPDILILAYKSRTDLSFKVFPLVSHSIPVNTCVPKHFSLFFTLSLSKHLSDSITLSLQIDTASPSTFSLLTSISFP